MADARERGIFVPLPTSQSIDRAVEEGWQSEAFRGQIGAYLAEAPDQVLFNRTDVMRATGRNDNYTNPEIQALIREMVETYGGREGKGDKIKHPRMTEEGFLEVCRRLGPTDAEKAERGRNGATNMYAGSSPKIEEVKKWETVGRRKKGQAEKPRVTKDAKTGTKEPTAPAETQVSNVVLLTRIDTFIAENPQNFYAMADVMRVTSRRTRPAPHLRRVIRAVLTEAGITAERHPQIPEAIFRKLCVAVGMPDQRISEARKRYWQEKGVKEKPTLSEAARKLLHEREERRMQPPDNTNTQSTVVDEVIRLRIANAAEGRGLPSEFVSQLTAFFGTVGGRGHYLLSDLFEITGRDRNGNENLRRHIVEMAAAQGVTRAWKTAPLLIPKDLAITLCLEMGPKLGNNGQRKTGPQSREKLVATRHREVFPLESKKRRRSTMSEEEKQRRREKRVKREMPLIVEGLIPTARPGPLVVLEPKMQKKPAIARVDMDKFLTQFARESVDAAKNRLRSEKSFISIPQLASPQEIVEQPMMQEPVQVFPEPASELPITPTKVEEPVKEEVFAVAVEEVVPTVPPAEEAVKVNRKLILQEQHARELGAILQMGANWNDLEKAAKRHGGIPENVNLEEIRRQYKTVLHDSRHIPDNRAMLILTEDIIPGFASGNRQAIIAAQENEAAKVFLQALVTFPERELLELFNELRFRFITSR